MVDKNKIIQAATKFVQKGQFDKAIREYLRIIEDDPKDIRILLKVGELYQKRGDNREAAATLLKVADSYASDGFFLKAAAVYKQVLKLNPSLLDVNIRLAELYRQLGLMSDAMQQFQLVAAAHEKQGNAQAVLAVLKKLVELEPDNAASRVRLAEAYSVENMTSEAIAELTKVASQLKQNSRTEEYTKVAERLIFLDPTNITLTRELANVYLSRGDPKRALTKLQICFKEDRRNVDTLILLAQAFLDLGQKVKTVSVYKELAKIYGGAGRSSEEEATWRRVLSLLPEDPDAQAALGGGSAGADEEDPEPESQDEPVVLPRKVERAPVAEAPAARARSPSAHRSQEPGIQRLLTETDVYLKYGLHEKASEHLKKILATAPQSVAAHEKAKDLYLAMGDTRRAADELAICAGLAAGTGNLSVGKVYLDQLLEVAPEHPRADELSRVLGNVAAVPEVGEEAILLDAGEPTSPAGRSYDAVGAFVRAAAADKDELLMDEPRLASDDAVLVNTANGEVRVLATLDDDAVLVPGIGEDDVFSDDAELLEEAPQPEDESPLLQDESQEPGEEADHDDMALAAAAASIDGEAVDDDSAEMAAQLRITAPGGSQAPSASAVRSATHERELSGSHTALKGQEGEKATPKPRVPPAREMPRGEVPMAKEPAVVDVPRVAPTVGKAAPPAPAERRTVSSPGLRTEEKAPRVVAPSIPAQRPAAPVAPVRRSPTLPPTPSAAIPRRPSSGDAPPVLARIDRVPTPLPSRPPVPKPRDEAAAEFAEAEFFIEQGLFDEAREAIASLRRRAATRPELLAKVEALTARMPQAKPAEDAGLFNLGTELMAEVSAAEVGEPDEFQYSVQDVLQEFKKGVEKAVRPEDVETHYELGIAYKEMGLTEEAIGEFEVALRGALGKPKEPDCLAMVGVCLSTKGEFVQAVVYFERALAARAIRPESKLNLHYEIGAAKEASGDLSGAIDAYERVAKTDAAYRDVGAALTRVRAARAAQNGAPPPMRPGAVGSDGKSHLGGGPEGGKASKVGYL